jgi:hypothetical protein
MGAVWLPGAACLPASRACAYSFMVSMLSSNKLKLQHVPETDNPNSVSNLLNYDGPY